MLKGSMIIMQMLALAGSALAAPATAPARPADGTFDAKGVKLHYLVQGQGETVVLIHGLYSSAVLNWTAPGIVAALAKDHQVIALDMPGHGESDKPQADDAYGVQLAEDVVQLMDHLKIAKAHIVGYSMGGMIAMKLTVDHPDRVISCTLGGMGWLKAGGMLERVWERMPARDIGKTPPACARSLGKLGVTEDELKAVKTPVCVLVGDRDPVKGLYVAPLETVRKDWPVTQIKDAGHLNCILKPDFKEGVVKWIGDHKS